MAISHKETRNLLNKLVEKVCNEDSMISLQSKASDLGDYSGGGLPYMGYKDICGLKGYGF